jgi:hypothetical protein
MSFREGPPVPTQSNNGEARRGLLQPTVQMPGSEVLLQRLSTSRIYRPNSSRAGYYQELVSLVADREMSAVRLDGACQIAWSRFYGAHIEEDPMLVIKVGDGVNRQYAKTLRSLTHERKISGGAIALKEGRRAHIARKYDSE